MEKKTQKEKIQKEDKLKKKERYKIYGEKTNIESRQI